MSLDLDREYAEIHRKNVAQRREKRRNKNVRWEVQILNEELKRGAGTQTLTRNSVYQRPLHVHSIPINQAGSTDSVHTGL